MAITYHFKCETCKYTKNINVGTTRMAIKEGNPEIKLGSCYSCGELFGNTKQKCIYCNKRKSTSSLMNKIFSFFNRNNLSTSLRFYKQDEVKKVECPRCRHKYVKAYPTLFSD